MRGEGDIFYRTNTRNKKMWSNYSGFIYVKNTRNNTIATLTDINGSTKYWMSAGRVGFKGSRKSTKYAAELVAEKCAVKAIEFGIYSVCVNLKGIGYGKQTIIKSIYRAGINIKRIEDKTPVPFNGCRLAKKPRL